MRVLGVVLVMLWTVACGPSCRADDAPFGQRLSIATTVMTEERFETVMADDVEIRSQSAVAMFGQIAVPVNEYFYDLEILDAATIKADGRELKVPSEGILLSSLPNSPQLGIFQADVRTRTIVFPDVSVGDTLRYKIRLRTKQPAIPGGFSAIRPIPASARFDQVSIVLDAPKSIKIADSSSGFTREVEESGDRRKVAWTLIPQRYQADEPGAVAAIDRDAYVAYSSYPGWEAIGQKLLELSTPANVATPELRQLADSITHDITDRREQARAIFDWVSTNVRYLAIFLGTGGFVPHGAGAVLASKLGDCKDHAAMMRTLLAAKGIDADYVFISVSPIYRDPDVPTADWFNHAILWLPEFETYVDPSASRAAFSVLPDSEADKVVLRFGNSGVVLARTPALTADHNQVSIDADVTILPDGTVTGTSKVTGAGPLAIQLRNLMAEVALIGSEDVAKRLVTSQNWRGSANIEPRDPSDRTEPYAVRTQFTFSNKFLDGDENHNAVPVGPRLVSPVWLPYLNAIKTNRVQPFVCTPATYQVLIDLHIPTGINLANLPHPVTVNRPLATYEASYQSTDQGLHISRRLVIAMPHQSCSAAQAADVAPVIEAAVKDFGWHPRFSGEPR